MEPSTIAPTPPTPATPAGPPKVRWWKRPWIAPLWVISGIFIIWRAPAYLGFTSEASLIPLRSEYHYLLLSGHVTLGSVTLICCCLQLWPWLRQTRPKVHRISGRIYVLFVIPAGLLAMVTAFMAGHTPPSGRIGNAVLAVLWLATTIAGYRMARSKRFMEHRRWMLRSFALCFSIVVSRFWGGVYFAGFLPFLDGYYGGDMDALIADVAVAGIWTSWVVNLLITEWWIERSRRPRKKRAVAKQPA